MERNSMLYDDLVAKWAVAEKQAETALNYPERAREAQMMAGQEDQVGWSEPSQQGN
jgi:hypothetical protein